jgi:hypothetical protein
MKVLVTEKVLRRTVAHLIREARGVDNFLKKMTPQELKNDELQVNKLLNMLFLENYSSDQAINGDPNGDTSKLGSTYNEAMAAFANDTLDGAELNGYLIAYLASKFGSKLPIKGGIPIIDIAGDLNTILASLGYTSPHSLSQLNRLVEGLVRGGPITPALTTEPGSAAAPRNPDLETGTVSYYDIDPDDTESALSSEKLRSISAKEVIDELVSGSKIAVQVSDAVEKYRKESIAPLNNSLKIITDAMVTSRGLGSLLTVDMYTPTELRAVAQELINTYDKPVTRAASAQRPPQVSTFALVDSCNIIHDDVTGGIGTALGVVGASLLLTFAGMVATPNLMPARTLKMLSAKDNNLARLKIEIEEAKTAAATVGDAGSIERLNKIKDELLTLETNLEETLRKIATAEAEVVASPSVTTYTGSAAPDVADVSAGVQRRAAELLRDKAALETYKTEYEAYRQAYKTTREDVLSRYSAAKADLDAPYKKDLERKTPIGVPMPTQTDYIARATEGLSATEAADFRKILYTPNPPPFRAPPAASTGISPDDPMWQKQIDEIEEFKKKFDEIERLKTAKRDIETSIGVRQPKIARASDVGPGTQLGDLDARIEAANAQLTEANKMFAEFESTVTRLETLGGNAFDRSQIMSWIGNSLADYKRVYGISGMISNIAIVTILVEVVSAASAAFLRSITRWTIDEQVLHRRLEAGFNNLGSFTPEADDNTLADLAAEIGEVSLSTLVLKMSVEDTEKMTDLAQAVAKFAREAVQPTGVTPEAVANLKSAKKVAG